jgi:hypothetical protein
MSISRKLDILVKLTAHLETITGTSLDGSTINLEAKVFRGRATFGADDPVPLLSLLENPRPEAPEEGGTNKEAHIEMWPLMLQGWIPHDQTNPTDPAYILLQLVEDKLSEITRVNNEGAFPANSDIYMLGGDIAELHIGSPVVRPPEENVSKFAFFYLPLTIKLAKITGTR